MRTILKAGAALMLAAAPLAVQAQTMAADLTEAQQADYNGWSEAKRGEFATWPTSYQNYYWSLTPTQQDAYWTLTVEERAQIVAMAPAEQSAKWNEIETRFAAQSKAGTVKPVVLMQSNAMTQTAPAAQAGEYPLCTEGMTDGCINPREAGEDFGNVPLDYWPGKPASEMTQEEKIQHEIAQKQMAQKPIAENETGQN